jgi:hypothetical protein
MRQNGCGCHKEVVQYAYTLLKDLQVCQKPENLLGEIYMYCMLDATIILVSVSNCL